MRISAHFSLNYAEKENMGNLHVTHASSQLFMRIAEEHHFQDISVYKDNEATIDAFESTLVDAAKSLRKGDYFFLTFCGHGAQLPQPKTTPFVEKDGMDEAICLYDGNFLDDALFEQLKCFRKGVKVIMVIDACYSGGMDRGERKALFSDEEYNFKKTESKKIDVALARSFQKISADVCLISSTQESSTARLCQRLTWFSEQVEAIFKECRKEEKLLSILDNLKKRSNESQTPIIHFYGDNRYKWKRIRVNPVTFKSIYNANITSENDRGAR